MVRFLIFAAALTLSAQPPAPSAQPPTGTPPKVAAAQYPVHGEAGLYDLGADYMVHSFGTGEQLYYAENFLVVEVALYPPKGESLRVEAGKFALRVNGKKLPPENPGVVANSLKHPEWEASRGPQGGVNVGGIDVGLGGQGRTRQSPYPGGQDPNRLPSPPQAPNPNGGMREEKPTAEQVLVQTALPEGIFKGPTAGFLYFSWRGKSSSIKRVELIYDDTELKLK